MDQFVRSQNVARYRRLLERVTDETDRQQIINLLAEERQNKKTLAIRSDSPRWRRISVSCRTSGRPLDALGITVAGSGEVQDQAGRPLGEREKEEEHRDQLLHICYL